MNYLSEINYEMSDTNINLNLILYKLDKLTNKILSIEKCIQFFSDKIDDYGIKLQNNIEKVTKVESNYVNTVSKISMLESKLNINEHFINV